MTSGFSESIKAKVRTTMWRAFEVSRTDKPSSLLANFQSSEQRFPYLFALEVVTGKVFFLDCVFNHPVTHQDKNVQSQSDGCIVFRWYLPVSRPTRNVRYQLFLNTQAVLADNSAIRPTALTRWFSAPILGTRTPGRPRYSEFSALESKISVPQCFQQRHSTHT